LKKRGQKKKKEKEIGESGTEGQGKGRGRESVGDKRKVMPDMKKANIKTKQENSEN
jgi:hypothetical protein